MDPDPPHGLQDECSPIETLNPVGIPVGGRAARTWMLLSESSICFSMSSNCFWCWFLTR